MQAITESSPRENDRTMADLPPFSMTAVPSLPVLTETGIISDAAVFAQPSARLNAIPLTAAPAASLPSMSFSHTRVLPSDEIE